MIIVGTRVEHHRRASFIVAIAVRGVAATLRRQTALTAGRASFSLEHRFRVVVIVVVVIVIGLRAALAGLQRARLARFGIRWHGHTYGTKLGLSGYLICFLLGFVFNFAPLRKVREGENLF